MSDDFKPDYDGAFESLNMARSMISERFKGINEGEAISYARGFAHGMAVAGRKGDEAKITMEYTRLKTPILDAGCSYMGHAIIENVIRDEMGKKKS